MTLTAYEVEREARIAENKARMSHLGLSKTIDDLRQAATSGKARARQERAARKAAAAAPAGAGPSGSRRRSERVQGQPAPDYTDAQLALVDREPREGGSRDRRLIRENANEEVYTMEHVLALGSREKEWELFVDGYDADGNRVYDKVHGATCHQCRQKTLGRRTSCASCGSLSGQLCGDCLFMRYGEHVDEVAARPDWACPHCRGLCNCSFHRARRGWAPTGTLYRRAAAQGYASVAHYLVLNNLEPGARRGALGAMPPGLRAEVEAALAAEAAAAAGAEGEQGGEEEEGAGQEEPGGEGAPARKRRRGPAGEGAKGAKGGGGGGGEAPLRRGLRDAAAV